MKEELYQAFEQPEKRYPLIFASLMLVFGLFCTSWPIIATLLGAAAVGLLTMLGVKAAKSIFGLVDAVKEMADETTNTIKSARKKTLPEINRTIKEAKKTTRELNKAVKKINENTLPEIDEILNEAGKTAAALTETVQDVQTKTVTELNRTVAMGRKTVMELTKTAKEARIKTLPKVNEILGNTNETLKVAKHSIITADQASKNAIDDASTLLTPLSMTASAARKVKSIFGFGKKTADNATENPSRSPLEKTISKNAEVLLRQRMMRTKKSSKALMARELYAQRKSKNWNPHLLFDIHAKRKEGERMPPKIVLAPANANEAAHSDVPVERNDSRLAKL